MFRPRRINSTDARKHFTKIIGSVQFSSRCYVVESYHNPVVRIINEHYIQVLEEVLGKKTVNQVLQITGNDRLLEVEKMEQIKKVFQRRLSGQPQQPKVPSPQKPRPPQPRSQPRPQPPQKPRPPQQKQVPEPRPASPSTSSRRDGADRSATPPTNSPKPKPQNRKQGKRILLLSNGKNYK